MRKAGSKVKKQCRRMERKVQGRFHETVDVLMVSVHPDWFPEVFENE